MTDPTIPFAGTISATQLAALITPAVSAFLVANPPTTKAPTQAQVNTAVVAALKENPALAGLTAAQVQTMIDTSIKSALAVTPPPVTPPAATKAITSWLPNPVPWMDPVYFVKGTGVQTFETASRFDGDAGISSFQGPVPAGVTINPSTSQVSVDCGANVPWTPVTIVRSNALGSATVTVPIWVFTPTYTLTNGALFSTITPKPGDIVCVRAGTYTAPPNVSAWNGTPAAPIVVVAYPGEQVTINAASQVNWAVNVTAAHDLELRGITMVDDGGCLFGIWATTALRIHLAQCDISGFSQTSTRMSQDASPAINSGWIVESCRIHENVAQNKPLGTVTNWASGIVNRCSSQSSFRHNRVYNNYGEGLQCAVSHGVSVIDNIIYDNWSCNVLLDSCDTCTVTGNIIFSTNPKWFRGTGTGPDPVNGKPAASVRVSNEGNDGIPSTGHVITGNYIHVASPAPDYGNYGFGGGAGTTQFGPNFTFTTIDPRWL